MRERAGVQMSMVLLPGSWRKVSLRQSWRVGGCSRGCSLWWVVVVVKASWVDLRRVIHPVSWRGSDEPDHGWLAGGPRMPDHPRPRGGSEKGGKPCVDDRLRVLEWLREGEPRLGVGPARALLGCLVSQEFLE